MTREWVIDGYNGYESLRLADCTIEEPGPTDVRLRIEAFALNWGDEDLMNNRYSFSFSDFPARIGMEACGIVEAVGSSVNGIKNGDTTTRSERNRQLLHDTGADHVFIDDGSDVEAFIRERTNGTGTHASFDPVGGDFMERYANAMAKNGMLFLYGGLTGSYSHPPFLPMIQNSLWFHAYSLFNYVEDTDSCNRGKAFVYNALKTSSLKPNVDKVFPMEGYVDAWRYLRGERTSYGKVVVETGA